jgi:hypothetical protein
MYEDQARARPGSSRRAEMVFTGLTGLIGAGRALSLPLAALALQSNGLQLSADGTAHSCAQGPTEFSRANARGFTADDCAQLLRVARLPDEVHMFNVRH